MYEKVLFMVCVYFLKYFVFKLVIFVIFFDDGFGLYV